MRPTCLVIRSVGGQQRQRRLLKIQNILEVHAPIPPRTVSLQGMSLCPFSTVSSRQNICTVCMGAKINQFFRGVSGNLLLNSFVWRAQHSSGKQTNTKDSLCLGCPDSCPNPYLGEFSISMSLFASAGLQRPN